MRLIVATLIVTFVTASAHAQQQPPPPPAPDPWMQPPGSGPYAPPPPPMQAYTPEEQDLLAKGEISAGQILAGGMLGLFVGFGVGQAVEGRYGDTGFIFTLGEIGSFVLMIYGASRAWDDGGDSSAGLVVAGALGFVGFRIWEIIDVFAGPGRHNQRVRDLRARQPQGPPPSRWSGIIVPSARGDGGFAAFSVSF